MSLALPIAAAALPSQGITPMKQVDTHDTPISSSRSIKGKPHPNAFSQLASNLCNALEDLVNSIKPPTQHGHLAYNFLPLMHESPPTPCTHIEGSIPLSLNGVFLRNGSNPLYHPRGGYHLFDGDGMVHAVTLADGHATHACRFTRTNRFMSSKAVGRPLFLNPLGELNGLDGVAKVVIFLFRHVLGLLNACQGIGPANAGLTYIDGKILAMSEDDMPYWIHISPDGDIHTIDRFDFYGRLTSSMTAHPKVDPITGEMFSFSYNIMAPPYLKYFMVTPDGKKQKDVPISVKEPILVHDFAITENYVVFHDNQMVFRLYKMWIGGHAITYDTDKVPRVAILPRYDTDVKNIRWFDCPKDFGNCLHFVNAWEEGDEVTMVGSVIEQVDLIFALKYKDLEKIQCRLTKFKFNLKSGSASSEQVSHANIDVGRINESYIGRKMRYAYLCTAGPWPKYAGICKVDMEASHLSQSMARPVGDRQDAKMLDEPCIVGHRTFGEGRFGSEPLFVPRSSDPCIDEDDGYVLTFVHDEIQDCSQLLIMDAQSSELAIIASITLPTRVPYGFHSMFVDEASLKQQKAAW